MEACLAAVVDGTDDGDVLLIDCHLTERTEAAILHDLPGDTDAETDPWVAIVGLPVAAGPAPIPFPADLLPAGAAAFSCLLRDGR